MPFINISIPPRIDVYYHTVNDDVFEQKLDSILDLLSAIQRKEVQMSAALDALAVQVAENTAVEQAALVLIQGIAAQLLELKEDPAAIAALAAQLDATSEALAAAVLANTPAE